MAINLHRPQQLERSIMSDAKVTDLALEVLTKYYNNCTLSRSGNDEQIERVCMTKNGHWQCYNTAHKVLKTELCMLPENIEEIIIDKIHIETLINAANEIFMIRLSGGKMMNFKEFFFDFPEAEILDKLLTRLNFVQYQFGHYSNAATFDSSEMKTIEIFTSIREYVVKDLHQFFMANFITNVAWWS